MRRMYRAYVLGIGAALALSAPNGLAQGPAGNPGRPGGGPAGGVAADRVQGQIGQRVQGQMQQRVQAQGQAQAQARVQQQVQNRIHAEGKRAAELAQQLSQNSARRPIPADAARATDNRGGMRAGIQSNGRADLQNSVALEASNGNARAGLEIAANASGMNGLSDADLAIYDNIFGKFNPMRGQAGSSRPETVAPGIQIAAQKRRAEIAQLRDQAIATGQTDLLARADEMEARLDAFVAAQQQIQRGQAGQPESPRTASRVDMDKPISTLQN